MKVDRHGKAKILTQSEIQLLFRQGLLKAYQHPENGYLFPGRWGKGHINSDSAARILREAFARVEIEGGSTHSFRRTGLTQLSNAGIPLRVIQEISGHNNLEQLQKYLEVKPEQIRGAVAALSMISHAGEGGELGIESWGSSHSANIRPKT